MSNVSVFLDLLKYIFALFFILIIVFAYYTSWGEIGFVAGLLTVAVGWVLQKPISGIFAWILIITRRPFRIGDRIIINNTKLYYFPITNIIRTKITIVKMSVLDSSMPRNISI